jgi:hypothetical protein
MAEKSPLTEKDVDALTRANYISGGLIAVVLVIFPGYISSNLNQLDVATYVSLFAFALCLPPLGIKLYINTVTLSHKYYPATMLNLSLQLLYYVGIVSACVGVAAAFWHVSWIAGLLITSMAILMLPGVLRYNSFFEHEDGNSGQRVVKPEK